MGRSGQEKETNKHLSRTQHKSANKLITNLHDEEVISTRTTTGRKATRHHPNNPTDHG